MKRPLLVTIIGIIGIIGGIGQTIFGFLLFGLRNKQSFLDDAGIESGHAGIIAIICIIVGIVTVIFSIGLLQGNRIARGLLGISEVAQLAMGVYALATLDSARRPGAIGSIISALIVLYFIFGTDKAKAYFAKS